MIAFTGMAERLEAIRGIRPTPVQPRPVPTLVKRRRRRRWPWIAAGCVVLLLAMRGRHTAPQGPPLHTVQARRGNLVKSVVATGKIEPKTKVDVKAKVNGIVKVLRVDTGDPVHEGDVVAELDQEVAQARVSEARAALANAMAGAERAKNEVNSAERNFAQQESARFEKLRTEGVISEREYDKVHTDAEVASVRYGTTQANLKAAEAQIDEAKAALEQAENEQRYATIVSPLTGIVLSRPIDVGAGVSGVGSASGFGTTIMTVGDVSELHVVGQVDEIDMGAVAVGLPARVRVDAFREGAFTGTVTRIAPQGNEKDKVINFEVEVAITGDTAGLRPMMTADAEIILAERSNVVLVPEAAIVRDGGATFVETPAAPGSTEKRRVPVTLGVGNGADVEVVSGVGEGDPVVGP